MCEHSNYKLSQLGIAAILYKVLDKPMPSPMDRNQFSHWLTGFIDGEGNFQAFMDNGRLRLIFRIRLHIDDIAVLHTIREFLGVGSVTSNNDTCLYMISDRTSLSSVLIPLLNEYNLYTTKWLDYLTFRTLLEFLCNSHTALLSQADKEWIVPLISNMNSGRESYDYSLIPTLVVNPYWLLGFIEAEGTFGIRNSVPYFQVAQHIKSTIVLDSITSYLKSLPQLFTFTLNSPQVAVGKVVNRKTDVAVLSINNIDALYDYFMFFLLDMPFQTRKGIDFYYWCIVLHMHKFGHYYLAQGKALVVAIANFINKGRYSNNPNRVDAPSLSLIQEVLGLTLPVKLTPQMSHLHLAQAFSRLVTTRTVFIYDNGVLLNEVPYSSYGDALESIGQPRTSSAIKRNIDTGKLFHKRYEFCSTIKSPF